MLRALAEMQVTVRDAKGAVMAEAQGSAVLDNPVNAVLWLVSKGVEMKAGDLTPIIHEAA